MKAPPAGARTPYRGLDQTTEVFGLSQDSTDGHHPPWCDRSEQGPAVHTATWRVPLGPGARRQPAFVVLAALDGRVPHVDLFCDGAMHMLRLADACALGAALSEAARRAPETAPRAAR